MLLKFVTWLLLPALIAFGSNSVDGVIAQKTIDKSPPPSRSKVERARSDSQTDPDWPGRKTNWHGFDKFQFSFEKRNAFVVVPSRPLPGNPWVWRMRFPGYHDTMDRKLVAKGFHLAYMDNAGLLGAPPAIRNLELFYEQLTTRHRLSKTPAVEGVSRGGLFAYQWLIKHPDKLSCVYCDTPVLDFKSWPLGKGQGKGHSATWKACLEAYGMTEEQALRYKGNPVDCAQIIAKSKIPLLHVVSENDQIVPPNENTYLLKNRLAKLDHPLEVISVAEGTAKSSGHHFEHPHPQKVVDFIVRHATSTSKQPAISKPIKALLVTGGSSHDYNAQKRLITDGIADRINIEWTIVHQGGSDRNRMIELFKKKDWANGFDVVVHNVCFGGVTDVKFIEGIAKAHENGTPAVVIHCSAHSFRNAKTDAWRKVLGVSSFSHERHRPLEVKNLDNEHPVMKGFPKTWKTPNGELYKIRKERPNCKPLASAFGEDTQKDHTCVWTNSVGKGKVFGTTLGHHNETVSEDIYLSLISRGLLWACDKLQKDGTPAKGYAGKKWQTDQTSAQKSESGAKAKTDRPNIVVVFTDDQGYGDLSCYGSKTIRTPNIDQIAKDGIKFTNFYAQVVCGPSRSALLTGRYPIRSLGWSMPANEITIAEVLQKAGYETGCIGKWDVSNRAAIVPRMPNAQGFDYYYGTLGANDNGQVIFHEDNKQVGKTRDMASLSRIYTDKGIEFLKRNKDKPFFLYVAHTMAHSVIDASPAFKGKSRGGLYGDTIEELDHETGRLLKAIDELGLRENTLVIFTTDNGAWNNMQENLRRKHGGQIAWGSSGPLREGKGSTYEGGIRVPCVARWPGKIQKGTTSDAIFATIDFMPTFAKMAGAQLPKDRTLDGVDQIELLTGKLEKGKRDDYFYFCRGELHAVRKGDYKLILPNRKQHYGYVKDKGSNDIELYNLKDDIGERNDLAKSNPEKVKQLLDFSKTKSFPKGPYSPKINMPKKNTKKKKSSPRSSK